jgi:hypothetical protein
MMKLLMPNGCMLLCEPPPAFDDVDVATELPVAALAVAFGSIAAYLLSFRVDLCPLLVQ